MSFNASSLNTILSNHTPIFGIKLWVLLIASLAMFVLIFIPVLLCITFRRCIKSKPFTPHFRLPNRASLNNYGNTYSCSSLDRRLLASQRLSEVEISTARIYQPRWSNDQGSRISTQGSTSGTIVDLDSVSRHWPVDSYPWRRKVFSLSEMEMVTNGLAEENIIGIGDHGIVYRGVLLDTTRVVIKRLHSVSCQAEEFVARVEVIGYIRHKNLVKLLGYCMEEGYRMLVNEYVDNGNLHQWLHSCPEQVSPLTWSIRMNIIQGIAKGLAYIHEDVGPVIFHQRLKSTNILLDHQWNPKISDFGINELVTPEWNNLATDSIESSGYLDPEYAYAEIVSEKNDVYSFGVLVMEIICGRIPVDHNQPQVYLIDWLKSMVANNKTITVVDPKLPKMPSSKELKRILLLALRCVDPDIKLRPTMGHVIHMLQPCDLLLTDESGAQ